MASSLRRRWVLAALAAIAVAPVPVLRSAQGQRLGRAALGAAPASRYELSETVRLDRAGPAVTTRLDRARQYVDAQQWDEAIGTFGDVVEEHGRKLIGLTEWRSVSVRDYCQLQLASLPPEALERYRARIDPTARRWYEQGIASRDAALLQRVVGEALASRWSDDALLALGEFALEEADYSAARAYWERAIPAESVPDVPRTWLNVPDTDRDVASIRARLVLASILEGSRDRAGEELAEFERLHPDARGRLGGRDVRFVEALSGLLDESESWLPVATSPDWATFAGTPLRDKIAPEAIDPGGIAWRVPLRPTIPASPSMWGSGVPTRRVAEDARGPLSYHPLVVGGLVLVNSQVEVMAVDLYTGEAAWSGEGRIFRDPFGAEVHAAYNPPDNLGVPRFTMTAADGKLYARMGSAVTGRAEGDQAIRASGYLVCLDLEAQGKLVWKIDPPPGGFAFDGSPVVEGGYLYVALRRSDVQPQMHVACLHAADGSLRWNTFVCAAETPARGILHETTHNLLTLHRDTLYVNTNLGAVAALSTASGQIRWVSLYPRSRQGDLLDPPPHACRDLTPCLYDRGTLVVAPADSRSIFGVDAHSGQIVWRSPPHVEDAVHLLGVSGDRLIASGERLYWISLRRDDAGKVLHVWPQGAEKLGYGRGVLAGDCVYWPTREDVYVFDRSTAEPRKAISLAARGLTGGNLLVADGHLLIAGGNQLTALREGEAPGRLRGERIACSKKTTFKPYGD